MFQTEDFEDENMAEKMIPFEDETLR